MLKSVFFDIDNTLILFNEEKFMHTYIPAVYSFFSDMMDFGEFVNRIMKATKAVAKNSGDLSNDKYFMQIFSGGSDWSYDEIWSRFDNFYDSSFDSLKSLVTPAKGVTELFEELKSRNIDVVLASNPLWPEKIQLKRASWAGIDDMDFAFVSHITNMKFCKPDVEFFNFILREISAKPDESIMLGNDEIQDMAAARAGMKTFLVLDGQEFNDEFFLQKDHEHEKANIPKPNFSGSLKDALEVVQKL